MLRGTKTLHRVGIRKEDHDLSDTKRLRVFIWQMYNMTSGDYRYRKGPEQVETSCSKTVCNTGVFTA